MTVPTRWYLQRGVSAVELVVERVCDQRGYRVFVDSRAVALAELPYLKRLVQSIGEERTVRVYDPVEI